MSRETTESGTFARADIPGLNASASSSSRPTSSYTLHSTFADSAVDMDSTTPTDPTEPLSKRDASYFEPMMIPPTPAEADHTLSDRMRQLVAVAWTLEQDDSMNAQKREKLQGMLRSLEGQLESGAAAEEEDMDNGLEETEKTPVLEQESAAVEVESDKHVEEEKDEDSDEWIDEADLILVRESLAETVKSMRLRQEEQRHLHQLTIQKLEAVAQRCIEQEQQNQRLLREMQELRLENQNLKAENEELQEKAEVLEADASRNEVAVEAMSSAVTGLEGWIETTTPSKPETPEPSRTTKRQKVVIRGKGRFRGRYYVDEDGDEAVAYSLADATADGQELHDGVKAWLRGFRDVEEELRQHESPRPQGRFRVMEHHEGSDWGDFQSPRPHSPTP